MRLMGLFSTTAVQDLPQQSVKSNSSAAAFCASHRSRRSCRSLDTIKRTTTTHKNQYPSLSSPRPCLLRNSCPHHPDTPPPISIGPNATSPPTCTCSIISRLNRGRTTPCDPAAGGQRRGARLGRPPRHGRRTQVLRLGDRRPPRRLQHSRCGRLERTRMRITGVGGAGLSGPVGDGMASR